MFVVKSCGCSSLKCIHSFRETGRNFFWSLRISTGTRNRSLFLLSSQKSPKTINWRVLGKCYGYDWCTKSPWLKSNHKTVDLSRPDAAMRLNKLCETERTRSLCAPAAALKVMACGSLWADDRPNSASSVECTTFYIGVDLELKESLITGDGLLLFRYCLETTNVVRNS